jgi:hypothetical protein
MAHGMVVIRVYLDDHHQGVVTCLYCRVKQPITASHANEHLRKTFLHVQCRVCDRVCALRFDVRSHSRITVALPGQLLQLNTRQTLDTITVTSLSVAGMGFLTTPQVRCHPGERYDVVFCLNDQARSLVFEEIVIARIEGQMVGATFCPQASYPHTLDLSLLAAMSEPWRA